MKKVDIEPVLPPTAVEVAAKDDFIKLNPEYAKYLPPPQSAAPRPSSEALQASIDQVCGRNQPPAEPDPMTKKMSELRTQYETEVAERGQDAATKRANDIFNSVQPKPETA
jgi:hypothetical protein